MSCECLSYRNSNATLRFLVLLSPKTIAKPRTILFPPRSHSCTCHHTRWQLRVTPSENQFLGLAIFSELFPYHLNLACTRHAERANHSMIQTFLSSSIGPAGQKCYRQLCPHELWTTEKDVQSTTETLNSLFRTGTYIHLVELWTKLFLLNLGFFNWHNYRSEICHLSVV